MRDSERVISVGQGREPQELAAAREALAWGVVLIAIVAFACSACGSARAGDPWRREKGTRMKTYNVWVTGSSGLTVLVFADWIRDRARARRELKAWKFLADGKGLEPRLVEREQRDPVDIAAAN